MMMHDALLVDIHHSGYSHMIQQFLKYNACCCMLQLLLLHYFIITYYFIIIIIIIITLIAVRLSIIVIVSI